MKMKGSKSAKDKSLKEDGWYWFGGIYCMYGGLLYPSYRFFLRNDQKNMNTLFLLGLNKWLWVLATILLPYHSLNVQFTYSDHQTSSAPDFILTDLEGNTHQLDQYRGKYVVLEWFNFRCRTVDMLYKSGAIPRVQGHYDEEEVVWLSITSAGVGKGEGMLSVDQLIRQVDKRSGNQDAVLIDEEGHVGQLYGVRIVPFFVVIDPDGMIVYEGAFDDTPDPYKEREEGSINYIQAALDDARSDREVRISTTEPYGCEIKYTR